MNFSSANHTSALLSTSLAEKLGEPTLFVLVASYATSLLVSLPTNGYIVKLILSGSPEKGTSEIFQLNLSASEFTFSLSGVLFFLRVYRMSDPLNQAFFFSCGLFFTLRPLFQSLICVEQYLAVVRPLVFLRCKPLRYRLACCGAAWLAALPLSLVCTTSSFGKPFLYMVAVQYLVFLLVISFCCYSVLTALKRPRPGQGEREGGGGGGGGGNRNRKAFRYIRIHLVYVLFTHMPVILIASTSNVMEDQMLFRTVSCIFAIYIVSGFVPPFVYLCRVGTLRCGSL